MTWRAITIAREYGSGGSEIAALVAKRLGWQLLDAALLNEVSRQAELPPSETVALDERVDPWLHRLTRPLWGKAVDGFSFVSPITIFDAREAASLSAGIILDAYEGGRCVIVGRGAQCVLHGKPDVYHVFVYADRAERLRRARERTSPPAAAVELIHKIDSQREDYLRHYYGADPLDPHLYDLLLNPHGSPDAAARMIIDAMYTIARPIPLARLVPAA